MQKRNNRYIILDLILKVFILVFYIIVTFNQTALCFLEKKYFYNFNHKEYDLFYLNKEYIHCLSEVSHIVFKSNNSLKYQVGVRIRYDLKNDNFLFFKNSISQGNFHNGYFKNISFIGFGYDILSGPIYFSQVEFAPSFYHIRSMHHKNYSKKLINSSWMYFYKLMNDVHYSQHMVTFTNFEHIMTNLEHALNFCIKKNTIFLKCSYNIILNENKFHSILPNINKYISISLVYSP